MLIKEDSLLVFATLAEAEATIKALGAFETKPLHYDFDKGHILITGMGTMMAASALSAFLRIHEPSEIINLGLAGALKADLQVGKLIRVASISKWGVKNSYYPTFEIAKEGLRLATSDLPIYHYNEVSADLVDMEGYYLASIAATCGIPFKAYKLISDFANKDTPTQIKAGLPKFSQLIAEQFCAGAYA